MPGMVRSVFQGGRMWLFSGLVHTRYGCAVRWSVEGIVRGVTVRVVVVPREYAWDRFRSGVSRVTMRAPLQPRLR